MLMSLETTLTDIIARLRQGRFPNEQAISQGIVLRMLQELGWDTTGMPNGDCRVAKEAKIGIRHSQFGIRDLQCAFAFHAGVPSIVLTDGSFEQREVFKFNSFG